MEERVALEKQALLWIARDEAGEADYKEGRAGLRHTAEAEVESVLLEIEEEGLSEAAGEAAFAKTCVS